MNDTADAVLFEERADGIGLLRLNRPATLNALTRESVAVFNDRLDAIARSRSVRAVVFTGAGRGFCAGQDVGVAKTRSDRSGNGAAERMYWQEQYSGMVRRLIGLPQAVIAAVNGPAAGVGMALTLGADIRVVARSAKFVIASNRLGLLSGESGMSYLLPQLIGASRAFEILLTGRPILAQEAHQIGLAITGAVMGSVLFRLLVAIALRWGLNPNDLKLITATFVFLALIVPRFIGNLTQKKATVAART